MAPKKSSMFDGEREDNLKEITISFTKKEYDTPVGIVIKSHPKRATIVTSIKEYSLIANNDLVGMELVSFNGITLDGMSLEQTIGLFRRSIGTCKLHAKHRATKEVKKDKRYFFAEMATEEAAYPAEKKEAECRVCVSEEETELEYDYEESFVELDDDTFQHTEADILFEDKDEKKEAKYEVALVQVSEANDKGAPAEKVNRTENECKSLSEITENTTDASDNDDYGKAEDAEMNEAAAVSALNVATLVHKIAETEYDETFVEFDYDEDEFIFIDTVEC